MREYIIHFKKRWWGWKRPEITIRAYKAILNENTGILRLMLSESGLLYGEFKNVERVTRSLNQAITDSRVYEFQARHGLDTSWVKDL